MAILYKVIPSPKHMDELELELNQLAVKGWRVEAVGKKIIVLKKRVKERD